MRVPLYEELKESNVGEFSERVVLNSSKGELLVSDSPSSGVILSGEIQGTYNNNQAVLLGE